MDGRRAVVEKIEHLAGVELGAAAEPFTVVGLVGGFKIVLGGILRVVLAALGVGESRTRRELKAGVDEVTGFAGVRREPLL